MRSTDWDKLTKNYDEEIMNPLDKRVINPLLKELRLIKNKKTKTVLELGCGLGELAPKLKEFKKALCTDYSKGMIDAAKTRYKLKNVEFQVKDMTRLNIKEKFDIVISVNSIIMANITDVDKALKQAKNSLKKQGTFLAIFPSLDADIYRAALTFDREYRKSKDETQAVKRTKIIMDSRCYDLFLGYFNNQGKQKHFFQAELEYRLKKAGFKSIEFQKVLYPWSMAEDNFLGKEPLWDWFVKAKV